MTKKTLYIHIGCEKTGTTSIQNVLADNRSALSQQRVLYPKIGKLDFAQLLLPAALQALDYPQRPRADYYPGNEEIDADSVWNGFIDFAKANASNDIIISAEHFSSRTMENGLQYLKQKLSGLDNLFNLKIIIYLRRQDKFMESTYSTIIKAGGRIGFEDFYNSHLPLRERYDFSILLDRWVSVFGRDALIVKDYEAEIKDKGLLSSFFNIVGINSETLSLESQNENVSWPVSVIELARLCNSPRIISQLGNNRVNFLNGVAKSLEQKERNKIYRFNSEQRQAILDFYYASNRQVEIEYFGDNAFLTNISSTLKSEESTLNSEVTLTKMDIADMFARFYLTNNQVD